MTDERKATINTSIIAKAGKIPQIKIVYKIHLSHEPKSSA